MTENPGTSFSKKPSLYAMAGVLMLAALLAAGYAWTGRTPAVQAGAPLEPVTIANITYPGTCLPRHAQGSVAGGGDGHSLRTPK